jgi:hypothetical protein
MGPGLGRRSRIRAVSATSQRADCRPVAGRPRCRPVSPPAGLSRPRPAPRLREGPGCRIARNGGENRERVFRWVRREASGAAGRVRHAPIAAVVSEFGANDTTLRFRGGAPGTGRVFRTAPDTVGAGKFEFVGAERADGPVSHPADSRTRHKGYLSLVVAGPVVPRSHGKNSRSGYLCFRQVFASLMVTSGRSIMR